MSGNLRDEVARIKEIEDGIIKISKAIEDLKNGRLKETAIIDLIHSASGVPKKVIRKVIDDMENLSKIYLKSDEEMEQQSQRKGKSK